MVTAVVVASPQAQQAPAKASAARSQPGKLPVLIEGARILDVARGRYLAPAFVLVENGRIKSVTPQAPPTHGRR